MQSNFLENQPNRLSTVAIDQKMFLVDEVETDSTFANHNSLNPADLFTFATKFIGSMDMYANADNVADYLNAHEGWFTRCARPMKVESLDNNSYILTVGRFGSFGYEVEPKIAVVLNPPLDRVYTMHTIPIPNYQAPGYDVDYYASMNLEEVPTESIISGKQLLSLPNMITRVSWTLDLTVRVKFPKFISKLSPNLIQSTGDRLLAQIIRQVSPRLTFKVQQDFHQGFDLPLPPKTGRKFDKID
jgi:hypothetical protein